MENPLNFIATFSNVRRAFQFLRALCAAVGGLLALALVSVLATTSSDRQWVYEFVEVPQLVQASAQSVNEVSGGIADSTDSDGNATILFWNDLYNVPDAWFQKPASWIGDKGVRKCPASEEHDIHGISRDYVQCDFTTNGSRIREADMVVFSGQYHDGLEKFTPPPRRDREQIWTFFSVESPAHGFKPKEAYGVWNGVFNWTATYRRDSDVPLLYGRKYEKENAANASWQTRKDILKGKEFLVAAIIGNCDRRHMRHQLIKYLKRDGIKVHVYGTCGIRGVCPPWNEDCYPMLAKRYKFFLAAENSVCDDYVTEKLFKALRNPWIPIVYGGADYSSFAPPNSVIQVRLLKEAGGDEDGGPNSSPLRSSAVRTDEKLNPRELVDLIRKLDEDDEEYLKYFEWRKNYRVAFPPDWGCELCRKLVAWRRSPDRATKVYGDIHEWWETDSRCRKAL